MNMLINRPANLPHHTEMRASSRVLLVTISTVRAVRGCDSEAVLKSVADATHPQFLRWVFNLALKPGGIRDLRFWKDEIFGTVDKWAAPSTVIEKILGYRRNFPRGEIETQWTVSAQTISNLVRAKEIAEVNQRLTRASLADFLKRRLQ